MVSREEALKAWNAGIENKKLFNSYPKVVNAGLKEAMESILRKRLTNIEHYKLLSFPYIEKLPEESPRDRHIKKASKYGWTFTDMTNIFDYADAYEKKHSLQNYDDFFLVVYEYNDKEAYWREKTFILDNIDPKYKRLIEQCFKNYEEECYQITIPCLMSILEHEVATLLSSEAWGSDLFTEWKIKLESNKDHYFYKFEKAAYKHIRFNIFGREKKGEFGNRNKIMHGSDDPETWKKSYALKLFINISTMLSLINMYNEKIV